MSALIPNSNSATTEVFAALPPLNGENEHSLVQEPGECPGQGPGSAAHAIFSRILVTISTALENSGSSPPHTLKPFECSTEPLSSSVPAIWVSTEQLRQGSTTCWLLVSFGAELLQQRLRAGHWGSPWNSPEVVVVIPIF